MSTPASSNSGSKPRGGWEPPSLEMMQALLPQYEFMSLLGRGGMGAVYKARQISLDRIVAIKVLPGDLLDDTDVNFMQRFKQEARTMARMNHPAIVGVFDFGETQGGLLFFVMEFVDGTDVAQMILAQRRLPPDHALAIAAHVCDALGYAHAHGVVHRDIKPANVLINMEGQVKVADFGLAKANDGPDGGLTKTNMAMGTPDFVAPEAFIPGIPLDGRADLYAVGVMLYQMLTGDIPRGMWQMPSLKVGADRRFDNIIAKAMQTDREMRYQTSHEIRQDLDRIVTMPIMQAGGQSSAAIPKQEVAVAQAQKPAAKVPSAPQPRRETAKHTPPPPAPPKKSKAGLLMAVGFGAVSGLILFLALREPDPTPEDKPLPILELAVRPAAVKPPPPSPKTQSPTAGTRPAPAADRTPLPPLPAGVEKQKFDLLALTDPVKDRVAVAGMVLANNWSREGAELVYRSDSKSGKLAAPVAFDCRDYEIELRAVSSGGGRRLHLDLPTLPGRILPLILHDASRRVVHEREGKSWPDSGDVVHISIRVRMAADGGQDRIVIKRLDTPEVLADWSGKADSLAKDGEAHPEFPGSRVASLFSRQTSYAIKTWTLRVFDGEARALRVAQPAIAAAAMAPAPVVVEPLVKPAAPAPEDPVSVRLLQIEKQFQDAYAKQVGAVHKTAVADLNAKYAAALDRSITAASRASNLYEALILREEKALIQKQGAVPAEDDEATPAALKTFRETYRKALTGLTQSRDKLAAPLHVAYDKALSNYQDELTRAQKLDEAQRVKAVRDHVATQKDSAMSAPAPAPAAAAMTATANGSAQITVPVAAPTAPPLTANKILPLPSRATPAEVREFIAWCIETKKGFVSISDGGPARRVKTMAEVPKGKLSLLSFDIEELRPDDDQKWISLMGRIPELENIFVNLIYGHFPMEELRGLTKLKTVRLAPKSVDDAAFAHLTNLKSLESLKITHWCEKFSGTGLGYINENLTELNTDSDSLTAEGVAYLARFKKMKQLTMYDCRSLTDSMLKGLANMPDLEELGLNVNKLEGSFLAHLPPDSKLKTLAIGQNEPFKPENTALLAPLKSLEYIQMPPLNFNSAEMAPLASLPNLKSLNFTLNNRFSGEGFKGLKGFTKLETLNMGFCPLTDAGFDAIATAAPNLKKLHLVRNKDSKAGYTPASLSRLRNLTELVLYLDAFNDEWLPHVAQMKNLTFLSLQATAVTDAGLAQLKDLPLVDLRVDQTALTDAAVPILKTFPKLKFVNTASTKLTPQGIEDLNRYLKKQQQK